MLDEQQLVTDLCRRDPEAFAALFEAYSDKVYRLAMGLLHDEDEAEGVVQDAFLRLFEHLDQFEARARLSTWLYRIVYNLCQDRLRHRRPIVPFAEDDPDEPDSLPPPVILADWRQAPERMLDSAELTAELDKAIATLPPKLRTVFLLREVEGLSLEEITAVLDIAMSAAKVRLHRARLQLREQLAAYVLELGEINR